MFLELTSGAEPVIALTRAELVKLLATRRTVLGFALAMLALVAIGTAATVDSARGSNVDVSEALRDVISDGAGRRSFISLLLGVAREHGSTSTGR